MFSLGRARHAEVEGEKDFKQESGGPSPFPFFLTFSVIEL